ncbi:transposase [Microcoleus sp. herbarium7]|uniref:RNA-guided endonuclease InsQ/TnpB family protein n=1 Tax=Microcoleus sp. herbarium7 TaxID=3055435 RepID=UPI002FD4ABF2
MSYQVEQHQITKNNEWYGYCEQTCFASKNLHNAAQFSNRQSWFYGYGLLSQPEMDKLFQSDPNYKALPAKVSQLVLKQVADSWKSYFLALEAYQKDSAKFTGIPKAPGYIEPGLKGRNIVKFNLQAISKSEFIKGWIVASKSPMRIPVKPGLDFDNLVEVRIVPKTGCYVVEIVTQDNQIASELGYEGLAASIDIGIDNLATIVFSAPTVQPLAINGKPLKSVNQWMNKEVARLSSVIGFGTSHRIENIIRNRNNFVHSYLHQATRRIVSELDDIGVTHVAIGKNPQWKTESDMGRVNNQSFVQIPHAKFIEMLTQKLERLGIVVTVGEESYTSKSSFLDWDEIPTYTPNSSNRCKFSGIRLKTKKYRSKNGTVIHADVNGAFNIGRKVLPNFFGSDLKAMIERNSGCVVAHPRRIDLRITHHTVSSIRSKARQVA